MPRTPPLKFVPGSRGHQQAQHCLLPHEPVVSLPPCLQFVTRQVLQEVQFVGAGKALVAGGMSVGHMAHLAGAAVGVLLVLLLARLPDEGNA